MIHALGIALICGGGFVAAYFLYGTYLRKYVLLLDPQARTPAHEFRDGVDYVPTNRYVLFGHHFASIAGLGPIVGPALAVIWGWVPALLWVFFGSILIGAVHDLAAISVSLRHQGRSLGDLTRELIGPRARLIFLLLIFFLLSLAMGVFALVISILFVDLHPEAIIPVFSLMIIASIIGFLVYRTSFGLGPATILGLALMFGLIWVGIGHPVALYRSLLDEETAQAINLLLESGDFEAQKGLVMDSGSTGLAVGAVAPLAELDAQSRVARDAGGSGVKAVALRVSRPKPVSAYFASRGQTALAEKIKIAGAEAKSLWTWILLVYAFIASVLPVWLLLQPRDYLNSYKLYLGLFGIMIGLVILSLQGPVLVVAPAINAEASNLPPLFPFLFITIACGAVSGFHSLVASGTTVRQLSSEKDAQWIGFGGMLTEGMLAVLVILACTAGLGTAEAWHARYSDFQVASKLSPKLGAFIEGSGYFLTGLGIPAHFGEAFIAVLVVAFAMTTLDSATRLLRYNIEEIGGAFRIRVLANRYIASGLAVGAIAYFALMKVGGKPAGLTLWQLFGTTNQLLAGLGLLIVSVFLYGRQRPVRYTLVPMIFMMVATGTAMILNLRSNLSAPAEKRSFPLLMVSVAILILTAWLVVEMVLVFRRIRACSNEGQKENVV